MNQPISVDDKGRSTARFWHSFDHNFVIKTLTSDDIGYVHSFLPNYHQVKNALEVYFTEVALVVFNPHICDFVVLNIS